MSETTEYIPMAAVSEKRGLALFDELIAEIESHDFKTWQQDVWMMRENRNLSAMPLSVVEHKAPAFGCGTVACIAGHAALKAGAKFLVYDSLNEPFISGDYLVDSHGNAQWIDDIATEALELNDSHSFWLFNSQRTWDEVKAFREQWFLDESHGCGTEHRDHYIKNLYLGTRLDESGE